MVFTIKVFCVYCHLCTFDFASEHEINAYSILLLIKHAYCIHILMSLFQLYQLLLLLAMANIIQPNPG